MTNPGNPLHFGRKLPPPVPEAALNGSDLRPPPAWIRIWLKPLPPERRVRARGAAIFGLFFAVPLMLGGLAAAFALPLAQRPGDRDLGGLLCFAPFAGLTVAMVANFLAVLRGYRLGIHGLFVLFLLLGASTAFASKVMPDLKLRTIKRQITQGNAGGTEFTADPKFKQALCTILDQTSQSPHPRLYVRFIGHYETTPTTQSESELAVWKLDPDFADFVQYKMDIPGAKPAFSEMRGNRIQRRLAAALVPIVPVNRLKIEELSSKDSAEGSAMLEISSVTRLDGTYTKMHSSLGKPILLANFHVDWQVKLFDVGGAVLYRAAWTTQPSDGLSLEDVPIGADYAPYQLEQFSAYDNFCRGLLGRLGLPPGPVKTQWSFDKDF